MVSTAALLSEPKTKAKKESIKRNDSDKKGGRTYTLPDGEVVPSVTSILSVIAKPALVAWSAKVEREMVVAAAADLYADLPVEGKKMLRMAYIATLEKRLGFEKANTKKLAAAGNIGTQIHNLVEWNLRRELGQQVGPEPKVVDKALWGFMVYEEWRKKVQFRPRMIEQQVWSRRHRYAGTTDWLGDLTLDAEYAAKWGAEPGTYLTLGDWKSGKAIYDEALMQVAAYVMALIEMGHAEPPINACIVRLPKVETDPEPDVLVIPWRYIPFLFQAFMAANALFQATKTLSAREKEGLPEIPYDRVFHLGYADGGIVKDAPMLIGEQQQASLITFDPSKPLDHEFVIGMDLAKPGEDVTVVVDVSGETFMEKIEKVDKVLAGEGTEEERVGPHVGNGVPEEVPPTHAPFDGEPVDDDPFAPVKTEEPKVTTAPAVKVSDEPEAMTREEYESWLAGRQATHAKIVKRVAEILTIPNLAYESFSSPHLMSAFKLSVEDRIALDERTASGKPTKARRKGD